MNDLINRNPGTIVSEIEGVIERITPQPVERLSSAPLICYAWLAGVRRELPCWAALDDQQRDAFALATVRMTILSGATGGIGAHIVRLAASSEVSFLFHLPEDASPIGGVVARTAMIHQEIGSIALRRFVDRLLSTPWVNNRYWTHIGEQHGAGRRPGSLASHVVDVAEAIADRPELDRQQRDAGIAFAIYRGVRELSLAKTPPSEEADGVHITILDRRRAMLTALYALDMEDPSAAAAIWLLIQQLSSAPSPVGTRMAALNMSEAKVH